MIDSLSAAQGVDAKLVKALIQVESAYKPRATSRKGAMGLMQLMPEPPGSTRWPTRTTRAPTSRPASST